jgi:hypothetical protein
LVPTIWSLFLQKDKWYPGYNGIYGEWVANFGKGAYITENFGT